MTTEDTEASSSTESRHAVGSQVDRGVRPAAEALHAAVCQAVALLNCCPEIGRLAFAHDAHTLLREALVQYADAYMDAPVTERERVAVARKHQRKPRVSIAEAGRRAMQDMKKA